MLYKIALKFSVDGIGKALSKVSPELLGAGVGVLGGAGLGAMLGGSKNWHRGALIGAGLGGMAGYGGGAYYSNERARVENEIISKGVDDIKNKVKNFAEGTANQVANGWEQGVEYLSDIMVWPCRKWSEWKERMIRRRDQMIRRRGQIVVAPSQLANEWKQRVEDLSDIMVWPYRKWREWKERMIRRRVR